MGVEMDAVVAGHLCVDMIPGFHNPPGTPVGDIFRSGSLYNVDELALSTGGAVSNTGIALKIFGCTVGFAAKVGDDRIGRLLTEMMEKNGDISGIKISRGEASSYSIVLAPVGTDRMFLHCSGTNDTFDSTDIDYGMLNSCRLFHFGYPTLMREMYSGGGKELVRIFREAKSTGVTTSLDLSMPDLESPAGKANWRGILEGTLPYADIFVPSIDEAFLCMRPEEYRKRMDRDRGSSPLSVFPPEDFSALAGEFLDMGCGMAALKAGASGWYFRTAAEQRLRKMGRLAPDDPGSWALREVWCPAFQIEEIASAAGSGDASIAGFLAAFMKGHPLEKCLKYANAAGWQNLSRLDATSGLTGWDELSNLLPGLKPAEFDMPDRTWKWNEDTEVWDRRGG